MNLAETRAKLAAALANVPGVEPHPYWPDTVHAGQTWLVWTASDYVNYCVAETAWAVYVALPAGPPAATAEAGDALADQVAAALWTVGKVTRAEPWAIPAEPGQATVPALRLIVEV